MGPCKERLAEDTHLYCYLQPDRHSCRHSSTMEALLGVWEQIQQFWFCCATVLQFRLSRHTCTGPFVPAEEGSCTWPARFWRPPIPSSPFFCLLSHNLNWLPLSHCDL